MDIFGKRTTYGILNGKSSNTINDFCIDNLSEWKSDTCYKEDNEYDLKKVVYRINRSFPYLIEPCIIYRDTKNDTYVVNRVSKKIWFNLLRNGSNYRFLKFEPSRTGGITTLKNVGDEKYDVAEDGFTWLNYLESEHLDKIYGSYENALRALEEMANEKPKKVVDEETSKVVIRLSEIAKVFKCAKKDIVINFD